MLKYQQLIQPFIHDSPEKEIEIRKRSGNPKPPLLKNLSSFKFYFGKFNKKDDVVLLFEESTGKIVELEEGNSIINFL